MEVQHILYIIRIQIQLFREIHPPFLIPDTGFVKQPLGYFFIIGINAQAANIIFPHINRFKHRTVKRRIMAGDIVTQYFILRFLLIELEWCFSSEQYRVNFFRVVFNQFKRVGIMLIFDRIRF